MKKAHTPATKTVNRKSEKENQKRADRENILLYVCSVCVWPHMDFRYGMSRHNTLLQYRNMHAGERERICAHIIMACDNID